ncbi:MAG: FAD-dependent oxidoreductase [Bacteroidota bacterium]
MYRIRSLDAFRAFQERVTAQRNPDIPTLIIPAGTCGQASGANDLIRVAKREILSRQLASRVYLRVTGCHGYCQMEPSVLIHPGGTFYPRIRAGDMARIVLATSERTVVEDLLSRNPATGGPVERQADIPFFRDQQRAILARNELVDPIRILNYVEAGGYSSLVKVLGRGDPAAVVEEVKLSGLRGRGGAGFPTGVKWGLLAGQKGSGGKFLVCNADEGDPGAYMDRSILEGNPHSILEGMIIGAYGTGATAGIVYIRNEYPLAIKHITIAIRQAHEMGILGRNILGTGFSFDIEVVKGAGAFVCGEETALIHSIEGKMGDPRQRPPFPVQKGIEGKPTAINNVETWANIPLILAEGGAAFAQVGVPRNSGTKIFSLVGKVRNTGLVEIPMGRTIGSIVNDIGGGPAGKARIKAVQTGGPSGGCIPARLFDIPIDYDSLVSAGSIMGSGGMIVMDENTCMVDVAKYFMGFLKDESCGKCFTCRKGTQRMFEILEDIAGGRGTEEHIELLRELAEAVKDTSMCGLGQSAPNPVLSTLRYFLEEYHRHVYDKRCDAFVCKGLVGAPCAAACPIGTEAWRYVAHIQRGELQEAYAVIREANPFPSVCARVCNHPCEDRCTAGQHGGDPVAIRALKRFVTDRVDPASFTPRHQEEKLPGMPPVAVVGAGPAGLTAAHYLSLRGHRVTIFEADGEPGGMLFSAIPSYRLPHEVIRKEIASLMNPNITLRCDSKLGRDVTLDSLLEGGFGAVFVAIGAHKSLRLGLEGEDLPGVYPSIQLLKAFNIRGEMLARGRVGIIGGGNSAVDAARVALRQPNVEDVTLYYRRTREDMPAFEEEIEAALQEGLHIETLVSPVRILSRSGRFTGMELIKNERGPRDASGRYRPLPVPGSEYAVSLDTLVVAISEGSDTDCVTVAGANRLEVDDRRQTITVDPATLCTNRPGVFAGGDVVSGPNTVVDAIAAGKRAALVIDHHLKGLPLRQSSERNVPRTYIPPVVHATPPVQDGRPDIPRIDLDRRKREFAEVEQSLTPDAAVREAGRCLRCDLEFTQTARTESPSSVKEQTA